MVNHSKSMDNLQRVWNNAYMTRTKSFLMFMLVLSLRLVAHAESTLKSDQVVIFEMKEDPSMASFMGVPSVKGFYALQLDDMYGEAVIFFQSADNVTYHVEADMKVKGDQVILKCKKN